MGDNALAGAPAVADPGFAAAAAALQDSAAARLVSITKVFGSTIAAENVSIALYPGSVLALVGENGAGKSTLVKTLGGVYRPDEGHIEVAGNKVAFGSPLDAQRVGVAVVHQHPGLFPELSIAENVFAGKPLRTGSACSITGGCGQRPPRSSPRSAFTFRVTKPVATLRISEQQLVEIARAIARRPRSSSSTSPPRR